jgi:hypothetical protein
MLDSIKRLFGKQNASEPPADSGHNVVSTERDFGPIFEWAKRRGHQSKRVSGELGFVLESTLEGMPWRMEWGASQRPYITGQELRMRMELGLPPEMQMLLLSKPLMDALERQTFEEFTDNVQTQINTQTPEEMRWLVMFSKVNMSTLKSIRPHFGAVSSLPEIGLSWLEGPLSHALEGASLDFLKNAPPFVLMTLRGRAYIRMQLTEPTAHDVAAVLTLFETATTQALRTAKDMTDKLATLEMMHSENPDKTWRSSPNNTDWQPLASPPDSGSTKPR